MSDRSMTGNEVLKSNLESIDLMMETGNTLALQFSPDGGPLAMKITEFDNFVSALQEATSNVLVVDANKTDPARAAQSLCAVYRSTGKPSFVIYHGFNDDMRDLWDIPIAASWARAFIVNGGLSALGDTSKLQIHDECAGSVDITLMAAIAGMVESFKSPNGLRISELGYKQALCLEKKHRPCK